MNTNVSTPMTGGNGIERLSYESDQESRSLAQKASERAAHLKEKARDLVRQGSDTVLDKASAMREGVVHVGDRTRGYVRDEPVKSMLMAAAVGAGVAVAVVLLLNSRNHARRYY